MPTRNGAAVQVTKNGGSEPFESFDGHFVYYTKFGSAGIWKVPVGGGNETQVLDQGRQMTWALTDQGIYVRLGDSAVAPNGAVSASKQAPVVKFYSFATRRLGIVREFSGNTKIVAGFSVSPDGRWIIYSQVDQSGSDLMLMENYR